MSTAEFRKLVAGFLLLAAVGSSGALLWSNAPLPAASPSAARNEEAPPASAFVEEVSDQAELPGADELRLSLTDRLAREMADGFLAYNPEGPFALGDQDVVSVPDLEGIIQDFYASPARYPELFKLNKQAAAPHIDPAQLPVIRNANRGDLQRYEAEAQNILERHLANVSAMGLLRNPTEGAHFVVRDRLDQASGELLKLPVPEQVLPAHITLIRTFLQEERMLVTGADTAGDPLEQLAYLHFQDQHLTSLIAQLQVEAPRAAALMNEGGFWAGVRNYFLPTAHAQWVVLDPANLAIAIRDFLWDAFVDAVKDRFVHRLVQQTITWIQGGGKPQFVTNWKGFLKDAANAAAGDIISKLNPRFCQNFGPILRISLLEVNLAEKPVTCTLDQVVQNIKDFANDFTQGGWVAYGATLQPQNNFWGSIIEAGDIVSKAKETQKDAAKTEAAAGKGYSPTQKCVKEETVYPYEECLAQSGGEDGPSVCAGLENLPPTKRCTQYDTTTPGATLESVIGQTLPAPLKRIVNAKDIAALFSAIVNSALNKLFQAGAKGLAGIDPTPGTTGLPDPCGSLSGEDREKCKREACAALPPEERQECEDLVDDNEPACLTGEVEIGGSNASGVDRARDAGWWCDEDPMRKSSTGMVVLRCATDGGTAFIAPTGYGPCNVREGREDTTGWYVTRTPVQDVDGTPINFVATTACGEDLRLNLPAGNYVAGAFGPAGRATRGAVCATTLPPPPTCFPGSTDPSCNPQPPGSPCRDPGNSTADYEGDLRSAEDSVNSSNPGGIADALNTEENSLAYLNEVAGVLQSRGLNATTDVKNGNGNANSGDLIAVWREGDLKMERYDAVTSVGAGDRPMRDAATAQFTGDIPLSCTSVSE